MPYSIRQRLLVFLLSLTFISWSAIAIVNYIDASGKIEHIFDAHLIQSAKVLMSLVVHELYEEDYESDRKDKGEETRLTYIEQHLERHIYEKTLAFQISINNAGFSFNSAGAPDEPLSDNTTGLSDIVVNGIHWRVYTLHDPANIIVIRVAEPQSVRSDLVNEIALSLLIPLFIGLPIIFILIWKTVDIIFSPLDRIAADIQKRNSSQLDPVPGFNVPTEIKPLINALNKLFYRLDRVIQSERRFTADAAHELRTPLAGLKTQAQIAMRTQDRQKREHALQNILKSVDRTTHLIEQLLTLARLEPGVNNTNYSDCDLTHIVQETMADILPFADKKNINLKVNAVNSIHIDANAQALSILLRNLLDNAIRYTPESGRVDVHLEDTPSGVTLSIADNGPGIANAHREYVFKRFSRRNETRESGSGLGLSIVKQIADLHHAVINLGESSENGLQVDIFFPRVNQPLHDKTGVHNNSAG